MLPLKTADATGALDERRYYCQNWRGDVVALTKSTGVPQEYVRYSSYGEPTVYPVADLNMDGKVDSADAVEWSNVAYGGTATGAYGPDIDFDGNFDGGGGGDETLFFDSYNANNGKSGIGKVSSDDIGNRIGYAAYQWDPVASFYHVRYRVYKPEIGRWTQRDPLEYVDGDDLYEYARTEPVRLTDFDGSECNLPGIAIPPNYPYPTWPPPLRSGPIKNWKQCPDFPANCGSKLPRKPGIPGNSNGCGPEGSRLIHGGLSLGQWILTFHYGEFEPCCDNHDFCYGACGVSKDTCDKNFRACMMANCNKKYGGSILYQAVDAFRLERCLAGAETFYQFVHQVGHGPFCKAQAANCICHN